MRSVLLTVSLLSSFVLHAQTPAAPCRIQNISILGRSPDGIAQVSNRSLIEIRCSAPARPFPSHPGESRAPLVPSSTAFELSAQGERIREVPSNVAPFGGGFDRQNEWVDFYLYLPLDPTERDAEARRYFDRFISRMPEGVSPDDKARMLAKLLQLAAADPNTISQQRTGRFSVEFRLLDGAKVVSLGTVQLEVLFKSRFSDTDGLPGYWQAPVPGRSLPPGSTTDGQPPATLRK